MRQMSADTITTSSHVSDVSTPSGSHVSPATHKSSSESTKRSIPHPTHNSQSQHQQQQQQQQMQKQLGNLVSDINALALDNNSSQSKASQQQHQQQQQQQSRSNQAAAGNNQQNPVTPGAGGNTNGNGNGNCIQTSTSTPSNMVWQQTSPNATNGSVKLISTENTAGESQKNYN